MYKERQLLSGEIITLTDEADVKHPTKPWQVTCWDAVGEHRWTKDFATLKKAEAEYVRFD